MVKRSYILFTLSILLISPHVSGQSPVHVSYTGEEYGSFVSWITYKDSRGIIWSGPTGAGAVGYNGREFIKYTEKDGLAGNNVISYCEDTEGNMWVGCQGQGISIFDGKTFRNISVSDSLGMRSNNFVSLLGHSSGTIYLGSYQAGLHRYQDDRFEIIGDSSSTISDMLEGPDGEIYLANRQEGLAVYRGNKLRTLDLKELKNNTIWDIEFDADSNILIGSSRGIFRYYPGEKKLEHLTINLNLPQGKCMAIIQHSSGMILFALDSYFFAIDEGRIHQLDGSGDLRNTITSMVEDKAGNVWLSTNGGGLQKVMFNGIKCLTLEGKPPISTVCQGKDGNLYLGGNTGIYKFQDGRTSTLYKFKISNPGLAQMYFTDSLHGITISTAHGGNIIDLKNRNFSSFSNYKIYSMYRQSDSVFYFANLGALSKYNLKTKELSVVLPFNIKRPYYSITGNDEGTIYAGAYTDGNIVKMSKKDTLNFGPEEGLDKEAKIDLTIDSKGRLWYLSISGHFGYLENNEVTAFPPLIAGTATGLVIDNNDDLWIAGIYGFLHVDIENDAVKDYRLYGENQGIKRRTSKSGQSIKLDDGRVVIPRRSSEVYIIHPDKVKETRERPALMIRKLMGKDYSNLDSNWFESYSKFYGTEQNLHLPYEENNLSVRLSSIYYSYPDSIRYTYQLDDEASWSLPQQSNLISFTNIPSGEHVLKIKALSPTGESEIMKYRFNVLTPWYHTWWFYLLLVLFGSALIWTIVRLRIRKLEKDKNKLEATVAERTKEVVKEKEKVSEAYAQLEVKNQEIVDSITYAKRIQSAILPPDREVVKHLPDSFIFYKPKDIVAGDFYWMNARDDRVYFAAADCTGHGVPGAMVSVVCNSGLNRSVNEFNLEKPGEILNKTKEIVLREFEKSEEEVKDGMDIALCCLDKKTGKLSYSGAHNPLWIIREGTHAADEIKAYISAETPGKIKVEHMDDYTFIEVKADKQPIGKHHVEKPFATTTVELAKGDTIYVFSDGFVDQFGGEKGKKLKAKNFKKLLLSLQNKPVKSQKPALEKAFEEWKGSLEQLDDVCVVGVRV